MNSPRILGCEKTRPHFHTSSVSEGATPGSQANTEPSHLFTQERDPETGLYYYGGRYYDPELGRFISADQFVQDPEDPQNLNRYSYVLNNPQSYIDPSGYFVEWLLGGAAAGVEVLELVKYATAVTVGSGAGGAAVSGAGWFSAGGWSLFGQGLQTLGLGAAAALPAIQIGLGTIGAVAAAGAVGTACVATAGLACGAAAVGFAASVDQLGTGIHGLLTGLEQPSGLERVFGAFGASPEEAAFSTAVMGAIGSPGTAGTKALTNGLTKASLRQYLQNVRNVSRHQLVDDLKAVGLSVKGQSPDGRFMEFVDKGGRVRAKIHPADKVTVTNHLQIYDSKGNPLDSSLQRVSQRSPAAHIEIR